MKEVKTNEGLTFRCYTPKELKAHLDDYIIGQDEAKRIVSVAVYNHCMRIMQNLSSPIRPKNMIGKSNLLIAGPTGCGKTYMIKILADFIGIPYYVGDATTLTQAGYVGDDVESLLVGLLRASNYNINVAKKGIIFIDEIDKIAKKNVDSHITKDPVGEGVQQALLKMIEGDIVGVPPQEGRKHPESQLIYVDTSNILFVGSGAFAGIEDIIMSRLRVNDKKIGYESETCANNECCNPYEYMSQEDLRKYGLVPEFVGRFPIIATVNPLDKQDLIRILKEPRNSIISQYQVMFATDGISLEFEEDAYEYIAGVASALNTGARSLRSILESVLNDYVYEYAGSETGTTITITREGVEESLGKRYLKTIGEAI